MKRKMIISTILILLILIILVFLNFRLNKNQDEILENNNSVIVDNQSEEENVINIQEQEKETEMKKLNIKILDKTFTATLYDNETTKELIKKLPLTINMSELHGNEKYYYFDESMPQNSQRVGNINAGDLMLYGSDCLVLFYESFSTSYAYTKIGYIDNPQGLADSLGRGNVTVTFDLEH